MKAVVWRLLGVRIGRRVFDDGCAMPEKTLVHIGDDVALNAGSTVQAHSLEDGVFKSDHIVIGPGATVGPRAFVHYGVTLHEGAVLDADAFLMKGQEVPPYTRWRGNPAAETRDPLVALPTSASPATLIARLALAVMIVMAVSAGVVLALAPRPPIHLQSLQAFPGLHLDDAAVEAVLAAPDSVEAGVAAAVDEARALLAIPGVVGVNLSGLASGRGEVAGAEVKAAIAEEIRREAS